MVASGFEGRFELVLVNDSHPEDSWRVIREFASAHPFVKGISLRENFGRHSATMAGLNCARGDIVVVMDDDLQHPPAEIRNFINAIESGPHVLLHALFKPAT